MKSFNVSHNDTFNTPDFIFDQLNRIYQFELDAACDSTNKKCQDGYRSNMGECGLSGTWGDLRVFCNPPFSQKSQWIKKAYDEVFNKNCPIVVMILPLNCMSTIDFYDVVISNNIHYEILKGRIQFLNNETKEKVNGNNSGTVIVYFKKPISTKET